MYLTQIIEHPKLTRTLLNIVKSRRIAHAYLFDGNEGSGSLVIAIAFIREIMSLDLDEKDLMNLNKKIDEFSHPDIHLCFPVGANGNSSYYFSKWTKFIKKNPYHSLSDWNDSVADKSNLQIKVDDIIDISKKINLNPYEGKYKFIFLWMPEKMNVYAANKMLKILEEPPDNTFIIMVSENQDIILPTILSRVQNIHVKRISNDDIIRKLKHKGIDDEKKNQYIAFKSDGNWNKAINLVQNKYQNYIFEDIFVGFIKNVIHNKIHLLIDLINKFIDKYNKNEIKQFIFYCSDVFRAMFMANNNLKVNFIDFKNKEIDSFFSFFKNVDMNHILKSMDDAIYFLERNVNTKMILLDIFMNLKNDHKK